MTPLITPVEGGQGLLQPQEASVPTEQTFHAPTQRDVFENASSSSDPLVRLLRDAERLLRPKKPNVAGALAKLRAGLYSASARELSAPVVSKQSAALERINDIRNSIIGCQTVNFSEHVYPLVAALGSAGYAGLEYAEARENVGTLIDRTNAAEAALEAIKLGQDASTGTCGIGKADETKAILSEGAGE